MTRSFSTFVVFPYAFSQTAHAIWYKYPNPFAEHVRSIDVLDQYVCPTTGMVYMERLIGVKQNIPAWVRLVRIFFLYTPLLSWRSYPVNHHTCEHALTPCFPHSSWSEFAIAHML